MSMDNEQFWKHLKPVHSSAIAFCNKLTGNRDDALDLYQSAVLIAMRKFDKLKDRSLFRPWLFRIIVNLQKNSFRSWWFKRRAVLDLELLEQTHNVDPTDSYDNRHRLNNLLSILTPEDRALIILKEIEGWQIVELAEMFGKPVGTIKTRLSRARKRMLETVKRKLSKKSSNKITDGAAYAMRRSKTANN